MSFKLLTKVFWESAAETTIGWAASGGATAITLHATDQAASLWPAVLSGTGVGALLGFCKALSSLKVQPDNGNSSYLRTVVAADKQSA